MVQLFSTSFGLGLLVLLTFALLQWFEISAGQFLDWAIGVASFWWLLVVVTVPWNVHFEAKAVLTEAAESQQQDIAVEPEKVTYVRRLVKWSLVVAIALHLISAAGLYALAAFGITIVGYVGSGAALLLTALRPTIRFYEYLAARLRAIRQEFRYPRQDILELRDRFHILESQVGDLSERLNPNDPTSWIATQTRYWESTRQDLARLRASLEQLEARNHSEHERLEREAQHAIAQLNEDSQFLDRVREIIRFFKSA